MQTLDRGQTFVERATLSFYIFHSLYMFEQNIIVQTHSKATKQQQLLLKSVITLALTV